MFDDRLNSADDTKMLKVIKRCYHCGEECPKTKVSCENCKLVKNRQEMCEENVEIFRSHGLEYHCQYCKI